MKKILTVCFIFCAFFAAQNNLFGQADDGVCATTTTINPTVDPGQATACSDGSDAITFAPASGSLPDAEYVIEVNGVIVDINIDGSIDPDSIAVGDQVCATGFTYDLAAINGILTTASTVCAPGGALDCDVAFSLPGIGQTIADLVAGVNDGMPGLNSLQEALDLAGSFGAPIASVADAVVALDGVNVQIGALLGNICYATTAATCYDIIDCTPAACTLMAPACNACAAGETTNTVDLAVGTGFNDAGTFGGGPAPTFPDYDNTTNMGTLTILAGSADAYAVSGINDIVLSDVPTELCLTADLNVISGAVPFTIEFRIENGTGAPGNGGEALVFDATIDGTGTCSIGGNFADGTLVDNNANGVFDYNLGGTTIAVALASFGQGPLPEDLIVEISNIQFSYCTVPAACTAAAGTLTADANAPCDETSYIISATPNGDISVPTDYEVIYVLTSGTGLVIVATSTTPSFDLVALGLPLTGNYTIHTLVAETSDPTSPDYLDLSVVVPGTTTGIDVFTIIGVNMLCAELDVAGAPIAVACSVICTNPPSVTYIDYAGNLPCEASCGTPFDAGFDIWQNESYTTGTLLAGSEYTVSVQAGAAACGAGYIGTVEVVIYAYDPATAMPIGPPIAFNSDMCGTGPLTFTVPADGEYIIQVNDTGDCTADGATIQADSGILSVDCGPGGATCPPCEIDVTLIDAIALVTTTDIALATYCPATFDPVNNPTQATPGTITIAIGTLSGVDTDYNVTTSAGGIADTNPLPNATLGFITFTQAELDASGGSITVTFTGANDPACTGELVFNVADLLQGSACIDEFCEGLPCSTTCAVSASAISTADDTRICIDGVGDPIDVSVDTDGGGMSAWVITDANGIILALPPGPPFDLDGAGAGQCLIWLVNFDDANFAPMVGDDAAAAVMASSCAELSNPITVDRIEVTAPTISTTSPTNICADDGIDDLIDASIDDAGIGANSAWVITDANGIILALPPAPPFNLEGAGAGTCLIWYVNWDDPNFAPMAGDDAAALVAGATCAVLSNSIAIEREINCGACEEEVSYSVSAPGCDMTGAFIELQDASGANIATVALGPDGGAGTFGVQPCGDYSIVITGAPACYTNDGGDVGPRMFTVDGTGTTLESFSFPTAEIPTVGEWGLIILGLLMTITAVIGIRQRREEEAYG